MTTAAADTTSANAREWQDAPMRWQSDPAVITLPQEMLQRYITVALESASPKQQEEGGTWFCALDRFPGVWADGESLKACLDTLEEVLKEWLVVKIVHRDTDLPVVDEIDLTAIARRF